MEANAARHDLERRGVPFSEEQFFRQVRGGNKELVDLFLNAGISPNASLDGEAALLVAAKKGHKEVAEILLKAGADPLAMLACTQESAKSKDWWARLASLSGVF